MRYRIIIRKEPFFRRRWAPTNPHLSIIMTKSRVGGAAQMKTAVCYRAFLKSCLEL